MKFSKLIIVIISLFISVAIFAQDTNEDPIIKKLKKDNENLHHRLDEIERMVDDVIWQQRVGDAAFIDKVYITGPPLWKEENPTGQGYGNPTKFWSYVFIPSSIDYDKISPNSFTPWRCACKLYDLLYSHYP